MHYHYTRLSKLSLRSKELALTNNGDSVNKTALSIYRECQRLKESISKLGIPFVTAMGIVEFIDEAELKLNELEHSLLPSSSIILME